MLSRFFGLKFVKMLVFKLKCFENELGAESALHFENLENRLVLEDRNTAG